MAKNYHLGAVKPHVKTAAEEIGERFDYSSIYGWRAFGSVPNSDHPKGLAIDAMTLSKTKGDATAQYAVDNADRLGITYVIYWHRIWNREKGWHDYDGPNPHIDHVHISFSEKGGDGSQVVDGGEPGGPFNPANWPVVKQIEGFAAMLQDRERWIRVGYYLLGLFLVAVGLMVMFRKPATQIATAAIKKEVPGG
jgi:hypothetical protein